MPYVFPMPLYQAVSNSSRWLLVAAVTFDHYQQWPACNLSVTRFTLCWGFFKGESLSAYSLNHRRRHFVRKMMLLCPRTRVRFPAAAAALNPIINQSVRKMAATVKSKEINTWSDWFWTVVCTVAVQCTATVFCHQVKVVFVSLWHVPTGGLAKKVKR